MANRKKRRRARSLERPHFHRRRECSDAATEGRERTDADTGTFARLALARLTTDERLICIWKKLHFPTREIARHLARSVDAVEAIYSRAKEKVRRRIKR